MYKFFILSLLIILGFTSLGCLKNKVTDFPEHLIVVQSNGADAPVANSIIAGGSLGSILTIDEYISSSNLIKRYRFNSERTGEKWTAILNPQKSYLLTIYNNETDEKTNSPRSKNILNLSTLVPDQDKALVCSFKESAGDFIAFVNHNRSNNTISDVSNDASQVNALKLDNSGAQFSNTLLLSNLNNSNEGLTNLRTSDDHLNEKASSLSKAISAGESSKFTMTLPDTNTGYTVLTFSPEKCLGDANSPMLITAELYKESYPKARAYSWAKFYLHENKTDVMVSTSADTGFNNPEKFTGATIINEKLSSLTSNSITEHQQDLRYTTQINHQTKELYPEYTYSP